MSMFLADFCVFCKVTSTSTKSLADLMNSCYPHRRFDSYRIYSSNCKGDLPSSRTVCESMARQFKKGRGKNQNLVIQRL